MSWHSLSSYPPTIHLYGVFLQAVIVMYSHPRILLPVAVFVSGIPLIVGVMDVFFNGPQMKKLSAWVTCYEGRFESAPQLMIHLVLLITDKGFFQRSGLDIYGLCSSILMLGKDLSESLDAERKEWFVIS